MLEKLFIRISKNPKMTLLFCTLITLILGTFVVKNLFTSQGVLILDNSLKPLFDQGPGAYQFFTSMEKEFGSDQSIFIAMHPEKDDLSELSLFLLLDDFSDRLKQEVPGIAEVVSLTHTVRSTGKCIGKTWFHVERIGSVCENILDRYRDQLNCIENPDIVITPQPSSGELLNSLEETLEDSFYEDTESIYSKDQTLSSGFICTPKIYNFSKQELIQKTEGEVADIFMELRGQPLIRGDLLSHDYLTFGLILRFNKEANPASPETQKVLEQLLENMKLKGFTMAYAGESRNEFEASRVLRKDISRIVPVSILIMLLVLWLAFRNFLGVLIPFIVVSMGIIWTAGIFGILGKTLNLLTLILPSLLIAVGSAYVIHFMSSFFQAAKHEKMDSSEIVEETLSKMTLPLSITGLTTVVGFLALTISPIPAIRDFGLFASVGVALITLLALLLAPSLLTLIPRPLPGSRALKRGTLDIWMTALGFHISNNSKSHLLAWATLGIIAILGLPFLVVESKTNNFHPESSLVQDRAFVEKQLGGVNYLRIIISSPEKPERLQQAETINQMIQFREWLNRNKTPFPGIIFHKFYSPLEFLEIQREGLDQLKDSEVVNFFNRSNENMPIRFLSGEKNLLQLTLRLSIDNTRDFLKYRDLLQEQLQTLFPDFELQYTGSAILASQAAKSITESQIFSLVIAVLLIFGVLSILFVSVKIGFLAILPNTLAILIFFGFLGWFSIPIGVTISVIAAVSLGIGVDDTIHFVTHYNRNIKRIKNEKEALQQTLRQVGKPMIYTTSAITLGFVVFAFSGMESQVLFGLMTAFTLAVCLATDLHLLPAILVRVPIITVWDYLKLHYPQELLDKIGFFEGLSLRESKIVILMAQTRDIKIDEIIYQENDPVTDLFILLSGSVKVYIEKKYHGKEELLTELQQGRCFGALALFPSRKRMTSARAKTPGRLLVLNQESLLRLKKKYPLIATKLFINLARNLEESIKNRYYRKLVSMIEKFEPNEEGFKPKANHSGKILSRIIMGTDRFVPEKQKGKFQLFKSKWLFPFRPKTIDSSSPPSEEETPLLKFINNIMLLGTINYPRRLELKELIHQKEILSIEEKIQLDRLRHLVLEKKVVELKPEFANIFHNMTTRDIKWLKEYNETQNIASGTQIFTQGDTGDFMLLLVSGKLCTQMEINGNKIPVLTIIPGDILGARAILCEDEKRYVTAKALENSEVIRISNESFERMKQQNKKLSALFAYNLVGMLSHRLRRNVSTLYG